MSFTIGIIVLKTRRAVAGIFQKIFLDTHYLFIIYEILKTVYLRLEMI